MSDARSESAYDENRRAARKRTILQSFTVPSRIIETAPIKPIETNASILLTNLSQVDREVDRVVFCAARKRRTLPKFVVVFEGETGVVRFSGVILQTVIAKLPLLHLQVQPAEKYGLLGWSWKLTADPPRSDSGGRTAPPKFPIVLERCRSTTNTPVPKGNHSQRWVLRGYSTLPSRSHRRT